MANQDIGRTENANVGMIAAVGEGEGGLLPIVDGAVNGKKTHILLDTGASVNVVCRGEVGEAPIEYQEGGVKPQLRSFVGHPTHAIGKAKLWTEIDGKERLLDYYVINEGHQRVILGMPGLSAFGMKLNTADFSTPCK